VHLEAQPGERLVKVGYVPLEPGPAPGAVNVIGKERPRRGGVDPLIVIVGDGGDGPRGR